MPARQHLKDDYKQRQKQFAKVFIYCGYGISLTKKHFIDQFNPVCYYT